MSDDGGMVGKETFSGLRRGMPKPFSLACPSSATYRAENRGQAWAWWRAIAEGLARLGDEMTWAIVIAGAVVAGGSGIDGIFVFGGVLLTVVARGISRRAAA